VAQAMGASEVAALTAEVGEPTVGALATEVGGAGEGG